MQQDIYNRITEKIVTGLQTEGLAWFRPWSGGMGLPINNATEKEYSGINILLLSCACAGRGFAHNEWLTYKQCTSKGGQVIKGAKSEFVLYWNVSFCAENTWYKTEADVRAAGHKKYDKFFSPRWYNVFNIAECEGIDPVRAAYDNDKHVFDATSGSCVIDALERYGEHRPSVEYGGSVAAYFPKKHHIQIPDIQQFTNVEAYIHTTFHELIHSTGAKHILNRPGITQHDKFGTDKYATEELVAEIGAQFLCSQYSIAYDDNNSQAYINNWISKLQNDKRLALTAAQQAMKAAEFIYG